MVFFLEIQANLFEIDFHGSKVMNFKFTSYKEFFFFFKYFKVAQ